MSAQKLSSTEVEQPGDVDFASEESSKIPKKTLDSVWLLIDGVRVYELKPFTSARIGRLEVNDIVFDDHRVSREHAVLKHSGNEVILVDLASTHGTYIDGQRVHHQVLNFGEMFCIVSHELQLCRERPTFSNFRTTIRILNPSSHYATHRRLRFSGVLADLPLFRIIQFIHDEKLSGVMLLQPENKIGPVLYFMAGELIHVENMGLLSALITMPRHEPGLPYFFYHETDFPKRTIHVSTPTFLMQYCRNEELRLTARGRLSKFGTGYSGVCVR
ncbi:MAG: FHA domain-containing protein [Methylacidiphilales bacterium]|nr:FHA domain-containing protein [Candidatus Methylacidiphilales bacterium]MDW8349590.1 FHA domain-containing protein [Verrucomicrobiae bacterium]